jgi:hypothetical protein
VIVFGVLGGVIIVLGAVLVRRDHQARRNGARISYRSDMALQNRIDAEITSRYPLITGDSHDRMTSRRPEQELDDHSG